MEEIMSESEQCYAKATINGEPVFVIRAQDITAHLVVDFWVAVNAYMQEKVKEGQSMVFAIERARQLHGVPRASSYGMNDLNPKLNSALDISRAMMRWDNRKLAD
jgi:hypothetical protein